VLPVLGISCITVEQVIEDAASPEAVEAIDANFRHWLPLIVLNGGSIEEVHGCLRWRSATQLPLFNGVIGEPTSQEPAAGLDEVLEPFDADGVPLLWVTRQPGVMDEALRQRGFELEQLLAMNVDLAEVVVPPAPEGVELRQVDDDPALLRAAVEISMLTLGMGPAFVDPMLALVQAIPERDRICYFLALVDGVPAAASLLSLAEGVAGIYNVGTLEGYRGKGLGALVTATALEVGRAAGYKVGTLHATAMGEPVYRRLGFEGRFGYIYAARGGH